MIFTGRGLIAKRERANSKLGMHVSKGLCLGQMSMSQHVSPSAAGSACKAVGGGRGRINAHLEVVGKEGEEIPVVVRR
jgi:hypothetical protein